MKKFEFIDITTSDVAFKAYGKTLDELFENAALALFEVVINTKTVKPKTSREIKVEGNDLKALLFSWLNELLFYIDAENLAFSKFEVNITEDRKSLFAKVYGEEIDPEKHEIRTHVKACTYHKMEIEKNKIWKAQVILDI